MHEEQCDNSLALNETNLIAKMRPEIPLSTVYTASPSMSLASEQTAGYRCFDLFICTIFWLARLLTR
jgi:hypothetical protein